MLKEIVYWTSLFFEKNRKKKDEWYWTNAIMFVALCLLLNVLSIVYIVEYYAHFG